MAIDRRADHTNPIVRTYEGGGEEDWAAYLEKLTRRNEEDELSLWWRQKREHCSGKRT